MARLCNTTARGRNGFFTVTEAEINVGPKSGTGWLHVRSRRATKDHAPIVMEFHDQDDVEVVINLLRKLKLEMKITENRKNITCDYEDSPIENKVTPCTCPLCIQMQREEQ